MRRVTKASPQWSDRLSTLAFWGRQLLGERVAPRPAPVRIDGKAPSNPDGEPPRVHQPETGRVYAAMLLCGGSAVLGWLGLHLATLLTR